MSAQGMPPNLMALFAPRPPLTYLSPPRKLYSGRGKPVYAGISGFLDVFTTDIPPPEEPTETPKERRERKKREKLEEHRKKQSELIAEYNPNTSDCATKNPYATLFVGRLSFDTTEKKLKKEFEGYGPIKRVKVITDFNGKSRGYAFIEYEHETDLKKAYKQADGKKIDGRRVLVDVERSRTVPNWIPRRLGGGKGPARFTEPKKKQQARTSIVSTPTTSTSMHSRPSGGPRTGGGLDQQHAGHHRASGGGMGGGYAPGGRMGGGPNNHGPPPRRSDDSRTGPGYHNYGAPRKDDMGNATPSHPGRRDGSGYYNGPPSQSLSRNHHGPPGTSAGAGTGWPSPRDDTRHYTHQDQSANGYDRDSRRRSRSWDYGGKRYRSRSRDVKRHK